MKLNPYIHAAIWAAIIVVFLWLLIPLLVLWRIPNVQTSGQFGDIFGSVNALFSGLAFAGLIITILLQRNELILQRHELRAQREEMAKSREQLATQADIQSKHLVATVVQLRIGVMQSLIAAEEMESESMTPGFRQEYSKNIRKICADMTKLIDELKTGIFDTDEKSDS